MEREVDLKEISDGRLYGINDMVKAAGYAIFQKHFHYCLRNAAPHEVLFWLSLTLLSCPPPRNW